MRAVAWRILALLALLAWGRVEIRHATEPVALLPNCTYVRVTHPDPRRLVRRVDCLTGDTTIERRSHAAPVPAPHDRPDQRLRPAD